MTDDFYDMNRNRIPANAYDPESLDNTYVPIKVKQVLPVKMSIWERIKYYFLHEII